MALALLPGCIPSLPVGPPCVLLTVELPAESGSAAGSTSLATSEDVRLDLARAVTGADVERLGGAPFSLRLPGSALTLPERLTLEEYETAAHVTQAEFDEPSGMLQGFFHLHDLGSFVAAGSADPAETAIEGTRRFVAEKLPRPMEDPPFVWLHLDLTEDPDALARLESARAVALEALGGAPRWLLAELRIDTEGRSTLELTRETGPVELPSLPLDPAGLGALLIQELGLPDSEPTSEGSH